MSNDTGQTTSDRAAARRLAEIRRRLAALREGKKPGEQAEVDKGECTWPRNFNDERTETGSE